MNYGVVLLVISQQYLIQKHEEAFGTLQKAFDKAFETNMKMMKAYDELFRKHMALMDKTS